MTTPPTDKVMILMTLTRQLVQVLDAETETLRRMGLAELGEIQPEKQVLLDAYYAELKDLRHTPEILGAVELHTREQLEHETRVFQESARRNGLALRAARTVIERALQVIAASLAGTPSYRPCGDARHSGEVVPFALDRTC